MHPLAQGGGDADKLVDERHAVWDADLPLGDDAALWDYPMVLDQGRRLAAYSKSLESGDRPMYTRGHSGPARRAIQTKGEGMNSSSGRRLKPLTDLSAALPVRAKRADVQAIFETLRRRISTNVYPPGAVLKEMVLADEFGLSRTPIRQVLQRLEYAGLVQPVVGHGTIVTSIDLPRMREVMQFRIRLAQMLRHFLDLSDTGPTLARFEDLRVRQARLAEQYDPIEFAEISHEIRECIHGLISNRYMAETWQTSYYIASRLWFGGFENARAQFVALQGEELEVITTAVATGDPDRVSDTVHETLTAWVEAMWDAMRLS